MSQDQVIISFGGSFRTQMIKPVVLHETPTIRVPGSILDNTIRLKHIEEPQMLRFRLFSSRDVNPVEVIKGGKSYKGTLDITEQKSDSVSLFTGKTTTVILNPETVTYVSGDTNGEKQIKVLNEISSRIILQYAFSSLTWTPSYFIEFNQGSWSISMIAIINSVDRLETEATLIPYKGIHSSNEHMPPAYDVGKLNIGIGKTYIPIIIDPVSVSEILLVRIPSASVKVMHALMLNSKTYLPAGSATISSDLPPIVTSITEILPEANVFVDIIPSESVIIDVMESTNNEKLTLKGKLRNKFKQPVNVYVVAYIGTRKMTSSTPNHRWIRNGEVVYVIQVPERASADVDITLIMEKSTTEKQSE